jgi:hypothetical protein
MQVADWTVFKLTFTLVCLSLVGPVIAQPATTPCEVVGSVRALIGSGSDHSRDPGETGEGEDEDRKEGCDDGAERAEEAVVEQESSSTDETDVEQTALPSTSQQLPERKRQPWGLPLAALGGLAADGIALFGGVGIIGGYFFRDGCGGDCEGGDGMAEAFAITLIASTAAVFLQPWGVKWTGSKFGYDGSYWAAFAGSLLGAGLGAVGVAASDIDGENILPAIAIVFGARAVFGTLAYWLSDYRHLGAFSSDTSKARSRGPLWVVPLVVPGAEGEVLGGIQLVSPW